MRLKEQEYTGFEAGPIRPPSESGSLMLRVTRNCPWNKCRFCMLYKGEKFSIRPVSHIKEDIDRVAYFAELLADNMVETGSLLSALRFLDADLGKNDRMALFMAQNWISGGGESAFLQDANTLLMKTDELCEVIEYLRSKFPQIKRITSYGRSHTLAAMDGSKLKMLKNAGLDRIHIGVESGSDAVLEMVKKGVDKQGHINAGKKVKDAGIELSVYYMPGLGGVKYLRENAVETAEVFNAVNPDFIRIRTLAVLEDSEMDELSKAGEFTRATDVQTAEELKIFIESLNCSSRIKSDHILNLFEEIDGNLPEKKDDMLGVLNRFMSMTDEEQLIYIVGRRALVLRSLSDMDQPQSRLEAEKLVKSHGVTQENLNSFVNSMLSRFI
ncbi:MAG: radical SAM protein [Deferribacterales bacterium]